MLTVLLNIKLWLNGVCSCNLREDLQQNNSGTMIFSFFQNVNCIALNMLEVNAFDPLTGEAHGASMN